MRQNLIYLNSASFIAFLAKGFVYASLSLLNTYLWSLFAHVFSNHGINKNAMRITNKQEEFILVVFVAPLMETLFFQYAIIEYFKKKTSLTMCYVISAVCFALAHLYNGYYFFFALVSGLLLAHSYISSRNILHAIGSTFFVHALYNFLVYCLKNFL